MDFDALDLLVTIKAASKAALSRLAGLAIDDNGGRLGTITAGQPPCRRRVEQPAPQAKSGPAGKQREQRADGDVAELSDRLPLMAHTMLRRII
jgi:hypothetical protein